MYPGKLLPLRILIVLLTGLFGCGVGGSSPVDPDPAGQLPHEAENWAPDYQPDREQVMTHYYLEAPDGVDLHCQVFRPADSSPANRYPAIVLIPGAAYSGYAFQNPNFIFNTWELVREGLIVLTIDARGRGLSGGEENYYGTIQQEDFKMTLEWFIERDDILPGGIGICSSSAGIVLAGMTIGRYPYLPVRYLIDNEGIIDRYYGNASVPDWGLLGHDQSDDEWWDQREPLNYIQYIPVPYFRIQTDLDHYNDLPYFDGAIAMVNRALLGASPYVQLNDVVINSELDVNKADEYEWCEVAKRTVYFYNMILHATSLTTLID